ncbi:multiple inositol polyphosphate phosphatase 1-like [Colletes gigas]|uniref:multiple inositol polyphosphate phosphatase 1-like n=1 Tax=Colletes gigas TaxID=935657 RepID=UPI001C9B4792|nr:multiple inositol polyphosphate phosphatase 1-like [Colletes gigas]XP_043251460.1 multiple inositol polyphosphate phosphatase 1-like [Colletes gigas]XP_043251461.1 multiple inositol polyphosphate phosphatase 1-like [Colletes gigas]
MLDIKTFTLLIVLVCFENQLVSSDAEVDYCYSTAVYPYLNAGSKTAYHYMHGLVTNTSIPNCKPVQIWMLARHGTRYPGSNEINSIKKKLPKLQRRIIKNHEIYGNGSLCKSDIEHLKAWEVDSTLSKDRQKYLTKQGEEDLRSIAARYSNYFPILLQSDSVYEERSRYKFRTTDTERTINSMKFFIDGLFGNMSNIDTDIVPTDEDTLLQLYKTCKPWLDSKRNSSMNFEVEAFVNGSVMNQTIHEVSQRLGFADDLPFDSVSTMYTACTFERAWFVDKLSPWCAAFTKESLKVFEYEEDLYYYYYSSYGRELSDKIGCTTLQDMFNHFLKLEKGDSNDEPYGVFYFTHSTSLQLLFRTMGFAEDTIPLKASNYEAMKNNRKWRTSHLVPFAANIAAVFYRCDSSNKVRFYLNEKPLYLEGCDSGVCDWEYLKETLGNTAFNCNIDFCKQ